MTENQIKYLVDRFLGWELPKNFNPDAGISFVRSRNPYHAIATGVPEFYPMPIGTNLLDAEQATAMVRYMVEGMPSSTDSGRG